MVFGWGKKKEKEIPKEIPSKKEIQLSEVGKVTQDLLKLRNTQTLAEIKSLRNQVSPLIKELAGIIRELEKDDLKVDDIDKHLRIIVVRGKKQVIEVIKKEATDLPDISSIDNISEMSNTLNQKLKKIGDVLGRQTRVIHIFAKKYAEKLKEILSVMNSNSKEIERLINNFQDSKVSSDEITQLLQDISNLDSEIVNKNKRIQEFEDSINSLKDKIQNNQKSIETIKSSSDYKEFLKLNQEFSEFKQGKNQIKSQIDSQFTKISRPLSRYEYASSLDKEQKSLLSQLINSPLDVLESKNQDSILVILENVRKGISSGSISVKDIEKSMSHLTETEESLDSFITKVKEFEDKKKEFQNKLASFDNTQLSQLNSEVEKEANQQKDLESKISSFKKDIEENKASIPRKISEIQGKLKRFSNTDYTVVRTS
ncbi:MAG: exonuclease SbcC [Nitrosopumilaceae archaeon]|nr:exonuclease SbcC [Nitrosopumilaceae archaeon]NIP09931.1 exonuclease SbcC [Nitrosopumilaceae archaeon]NIS94702.1 exonuclease SbcC [Nitrosopumilaceae archaeon]